MPLRASLRVSVLLLLAISHVASGQPTLSPGSSAASPMPGSGAPATEARPVGETLHGVEITDPFRWLEGDNSDPENPGKINPEVAAWTDAQNAYTRALLDNLPGRKQVEARLSELMTVGSVGAPAMRGNRYFYSKREGTQNQAIIYMREGHDGVPRVLLDPNTLDKSGLVTISFTAPNHQGTLLAFGMYRAGDENSTLYVLDIDNNRWLAEEIPGKVSGVQWLPDSTGFFYERLEDLDNPYSGQLKFHRLGTHHRQDPILFEQLKTDWFFQGSTYGKEQVEKFKTTWGPYAYISRDARWMIVGYFTGTRTNDLWVADLDRWFRTGGPEGKAELKINPVLSNSIATDAAGNGPIVGDTLFLRTTLDAPNGRVVAVNLNNPDPKSWKTVIPERKDAVLESVAVARGLLVADYLVNASSRIERFEFDGTPIGELPLPGIGSAGISTEEDRTEAYLTFASYNEPNSIYRVDLRSGERTLWERPAVPVDPSLVEVKQVWYSSRDGTKVSMFVVHKKGLRLDGNNPTILNGYGGFGISETPFFSATLFHWFEAGGVFALPNLRGGGEYGDQWHQAGMLDKKQNVFDDFIAAAEWLIANNYTSPRRLGISGGSNGGLLTGAAVTQRPDLFSAVLIGVPLLDMLRYQKFLMARYWVPEYGTAENPEHFPFLKAYSPYHNIKPGVKYPAVFLTAGENDTRVHPLHARKMAAALRAATASDQNAKPILLWVDREAGHGAGKPLNLRIRDAADTRMFFMWQLGMLDGPRG